MEVGKPQHFRWLRGIVATVIVLNLIDGVLTLYWVMSGMAVEANPLMDVLLERHPLLFILLKLGLVMMGTYLLWRLRRRAAAVVAIFLVFLVYYWVLLLHLSAMNLGLLRPLLG